MVKKIALSLAAKKYRGHFALVDDEDYDELSPYRWSVHWNETTKSFYAVRNKRIGKNKRKHTFMHREILNVPAGLQTDHINHDTLDNRRQNLRVVTNAENQQNQKPHVYSRPGSSSQFRGVYWDKKESKWRAQISHTEKGKRRTRYLGLFEDEEEAALVYDEYAMCLKGTFAILNFPKDNY